MSYQIAIDGPAGAGKSTVAKDVAGRLGFIYVDTGAMYRAMGLYIRERGVDPDSEEAVSRVAGDARVELKNHDGTQVVLLNGRDVSGEIRTQEAGDLASRTSRYGKVRTILTALQKTIAQQDDIVMDGRDIGTTVLPDADLKIYLTASAATRAQRRCRELEEKGDRSHSLQEIEREIVERDEQDMNREISPLRRAEDAVLIDSSDLTAREVADRIIREYRARTAG